MKTLIGLIFYKLTWLDDVTKPSDYGGEDVIRNRGYYLIKRWYLWVLFAPIIILVKWVALFKDAWEEYWRGIFTYKCRYIQPKADKMTLKRKLNYIKRLL